MSQTSSLITDLATSLSSRSNNDNEAILNKIIDLFVVQAQTYNDKHVDLFDEIILHLATKIESKARAALAEHLADISNAPRKTIYALADGEITEAAPILQRSTRLSELELKTIAEHQTNDHLFTISTRAFLSTSVTDVLVIRGDERVAHSVASNIGAQLSEFGFDILMDRSKLDDTLKSVLGARTDIPARHLRTLIDAAKKQVFERLQTGSEDQEPVNNQADIKRAISDSAKLVRRDTAKNGLQRNYTIALLHLTERVSIAPLTEPDLVNFAKAGQFEEAVCTVSYLAKVPLTMAERLFTAPDADLILVFSRALNFQWPTVRSLLSLRGTKFGSAAINHMHDNYQKLTPATANRVLTFLNTRKQNKT